MNAVALAGLVKIELPGHPVRLTSGGFFRDDSETYRAEDATLGTIGAVETMEEGVGDTIPAFTMTILPPDVEAAIILSAPGNQTARATFSIVEYEPTTNEIIVKNDLFNGQLDQTNMTFGGKTLTVTTSIVSLIEKFFERNIGNTQNPNRHKSVWAGETGQDNATGLATPVAWGVESPNSGAFGGGVFGAFARAGQIAAMNER